MTEFLKYAGIVIILAGVILLGFYAAQNMTSNALLIVAGFLLVGGTAVHVIVNRILD